MAWYGGFQVLGPVVARAHLGGPAAWGAITAAESVGLIAGGVVALRFTPRRPMLFVVVVGAVIAVPILALAMLWPLPLVCVVGFAEGIAVEAMMVQWTVALATRVPPGVQARVSSYDAFGSLLATPAGTLAAGPLAAVIGVPATLYGAVVLIVAASAVALIPRSIRCTSPGEGLVPSEAGQGQDAAAATGGPAVLATPGEMVAGQIASR
jgi:MFS family permease